MENNDAQSFEDIRRDKRDKFIYPMQQLAGGVMQSFFATYLNNLMTLVYVFPIGVAGVVEAMGQALGWVTGPVSGAVIDRFSFRKSKYWPWIIIGSIGVAVCWVVIFVLPVFVPDPTRMAIPVAIIILVRAVLEGPDGAVGNLLYARLARDGKLRSYLAMWGKIGRDGMKVVVGFIFPIMLVGFMARGVSEVNAWALIAVILAFSSISLQSITVVLVKKSRPEKEAVAGMGGPKMKPRPITKTLAAIFTNRALLSAYLCQALSKVFFFYHIMGGMFLWRFYMNNMSMMAYYMTLLSLSAVAGAMLVPVAYRICKDSKRSAAMTYIAQIVIYAAAFFIVSPQNVWGTIFIICLASFFNGMSDSFMQPLFAHGADYSVWKSGNKDYGLNMAVFGLSITTGVLVSTITRTAALAAGGFDSAALSAGAAVPDGVMSALHNLNTLYPLVICVIITAILLFVYPLNDRKVAEIQTEIAARDAAVGAQT